MTVFRVGLTGGLASGKSTVAGWLRDAGFEVVDADQLVAELYRPRAAGAIAAHRLFGASVLTPEGGVDHRALADHVFDDHAARRALEEAIHPLVRQRFEQIVHAAGAGTAAPAAGVSAAAPAAGAGLAAHAAGAGAGAAAATARAGAATFAGQPLPPVVVLEATLLVEAGYSPGFDLIVAVEADAEQRLRRAVARGMREDSARARLAAQGDGERRRLGATRILPNDGDLAGLRHQTDELIADIRRLAGAAVPPSPTGPAGATLAADSAAGASAVANSAPAATPAAAAGFPPSQPPRTQP